MISVRNLSKAFGSNLVLKNLSFEVEKGETAVLLGRSGSGKSTMLRCLNLLEHWDGGAIDVDGRPLGQAVGSDGQFRNWSAREEAEARRRIGMVFQQFNLFPHMTVLQNVMCGPRHILGQDRTSSRKLAMDLLDQVGLAEKQSAYPAFLSGGQQQRVAIARALAMNPSVLLLDEVTSALDPELVGEVLEVIRDLKRRGLTMVCVTHEIDFAQDVADHVLFMEDGQLVEEGPPNAILHAPTTDRFQKFLTRFHSRAHAAKAAP